MATITYTISKGKGNNLAEIFVRFSASRDFRQRSTTNLFVNQNVWDVKNGRVKNSDKLSPSDSATKSKLEKLTAYLNDRYLADSKAKKLNNASLKTWIEQLDWVQNSLGNWEIKQMDEDSQDIRNTAFSVYFEGFIDKHNITFTRKKSYRNALKMWKRYEKWSKNEDILIKNITKDNLQEFREFFKLEHTFFKIEKSGNGVKKIAVKTKYRYIYEGYEPFSYKYFIEERSDNYVQDVLRKIKTAWNHLIREGVMVQDVFNEFEIGTSKYLPPIHISAKQRDALYKAECFSGNLKIQRDIHIFQCYVGCRYGDLVQLTDANIYYATDSKRDYLRYVPSKTIRTKKVIEPVNIPLHPVCKEIIERYKNSPNKHGKLLPFVCQQYHNRCLKKIYAAVPECDIQVQVYKKGKIESVKLSSVVSSHIGRKNFIGILKDNRNSDEDICSMSGHVEGSKAIQRYRVISDPLKEQMIDEL
jgi:hypothetical protein